MSDYDAINEEIEQIAQAIERSMPMPPHATGAFIRSFKKQFATVDDAVMEGASFQISEASGLSSYADLHWVER
jgi:hypothetical protein